MTHKPEEIPKISEGDVSADSPLRDASMDALDHASFAKALAKSLCELAPAEGLVIALHGPWGSGKTTILNFVKQFINEEPEEHRPIVIDFAPWWFSGQHDLTQRFFDQMAGHLKETEHVSQETLRLISEFTNAISELPISVPLLSSFARAGAKILDAFREARQKDLTKLKSKLEKALRAFGRRIIVVIDDIDRLSADEIRQIFGLVKAVANFPNITYLMGFDREIAVKALESFQDLGKGKEYLDKIVQVSWQVPPPEDYMLPTLFVPSLNKAAEGTPEELVDQQDLLNMFAILRDFLRTPRDCIRLSNALLTTYPAVKGEVNFTDFIAIEALRVFVPGVYELVRANPERFAGVVSAHGDKRELKDFHDGWIKDGAVVPDDLRRVVRDVVSRLFPKTKAVWENFSHGSDFLSIWRQQCRASSPEILPTYFRLAIPKRSLGRERVKKILSSCEDKQAFDRELEELARQKLPDDRSALAPFLERAVDLVDSVKIECVSNLMASVLNDDFIRMKDTFSVVGFPIENRLRIIWLVFALLKRIDRPERSSYLKTAIVNASGLLAVVDLVADLQEEHQRPVGSRTGEKSLLSESDCKELEEIALDKIRNAAKKGALPKTPSLARILWIWKLWRPAEADEWVRSFVTTDEGLLTILETSTGEARESSEHNPIPRVVFSTNLKGLSEFVDFASIRKRIEALQSRTDLSEKQRFAITEVLNYLATNPDPQKTASG
jgi:predicted KAP-like P-loop ATPase